MKSPSRFYSSLGLLILLNAVVKPAWIFIIDRQVQNQVGVGAYGTYFSLFSLSIVFAFLLDWGFTTFFNRQLAIQDSSFVHQPGNFLLLKLIFSLVYVLVVFGAAAIAGVHRWDMLAYMVIIQVLTSLFLFFRSIITANQWFRSDAWLSVLDKALMIVLCGCLLYSPSLLGHITIERFAILQGVCIGAATLAAFIFVSRKHIRFTIHKDAFPSILLFKKVLPFALVVLLMSAHSRLDAFLLERLHPNGAYEAGIYAAAYRLLDAANIVGYLVASFTLPFVARQWSEHKDINQVALTSRHFLIMFSIGVASITTFLAHWVQNILYHHNDLNAISVLQYCLPALVGYSLTSVYGSVLTATGHINTLCRVVFLSIVINLVLNISLIPSLGALGCCIAALVSQFFCGIATMLQAHQKLRLNLHVPSLLVYIFTACLVGSILYFLRDSDLNKWLLITGATLITLAIMFFTKFIDFRLLFSRK